MRWGVLFHSGIVPMLLINPILNCATSAVFAIQTPSQFERLNVWAKISFATFGALFTRGHFQPLDCIGLDPFGNGRGLNFDGFAPLVSREMMRLALACAARSRRVLALWQGMQMPTQLLGSCFPPIPRLITWSM